MTDNVDEFLAHHGVLGMKWGHHKAGGGGSSSSPHSSKRQAKKAAGEKRDAEILSARDRVAKKDAQFATLVVKAVDGKNAAGRAAANKLIIKMQKEFESDPDQVLARQKTGKEQTNHLLKTILFGVNA